MLACERNGEHIGAGRKCTGIGLAGVKHDMCQEILSFPKFGIVFPSGAVEHRVCVMET